MTCWICGRKTIMECVNHDGPVCHRSECLKWHRWAHSDKCACEIRGVWWARAISRVGIEWPRDPIDKVLWIGGLILAIVAAGMIWAHWGKV